MELSDNKLQQLLSEVATFNDISLSDIPDIDLYMDQVITLFEKKLQHLKRDDEDKILTKTMINNYAKAKIFPPVKSKKYTKEQIILLTLIYNLKQNLSLTDISTVFNPILQDIQGEEKNLPSVESFYDAFLEIKKAQTEAFEHRFNELMDMIKEKSALQDGKESNVEQLILMVFTLISQANMEKRMAEKIIDNFFKTKETEDK